MAICNINGIPHQLIDGFGVNQAHPEAIILNPNIKLDIKGDLTEFEEFVTYMIKNYEVLNCPNFNINIPMEYDYDVIEENQRLKKIRKFYDTIKPVKGFFNSVFPKKTIMVIGELSPNDIGRIGYNICKHFEEFGMKVIRCSTDVKPNPVYDIHLSSIIPNEIETRKFNCVFSMSSIIYQYNPEKILVIQNSLPLDFFGVSIPIYFYHLRQAWKQWIINVDNLKGFFYAWYGAPQTFENIVTVELHGIKDKVLVPHAWDEELYPTFIGPKQMRFGFMGEEGYEEDPFEPKIDMDQKHQYDLRHKFIEYAKANCGLEYRNRGTEQEYYEFIREMAIGLNVGTPHGINQRQYHLIGMGVVLMNLYYNGIDELGFKGVMIKDGRIEYNNECNCLLFKDESEMKTLLNWAWTHPIELSQIQGNGVQLAKRNTFKNRATQLLTYITK